MSNNVPDKMKPFGTLRDFGAGHLEHYETFLYGHCLGPFGTLRDFFLGHYKTLWKIFLPGRVAPVPPPPPAVGDRGDNGAQSKINNTQVTEIVDSL